MGWNYAFLLNLISTVALSYIHIIHNNVPWYITVILCLNFILLIVSSGMIDEKDRQRDERIKQLVR